MQLQIGRHPARLSLVGRVEEPAADLRTARRAVAAENHASRMVGPDDARWLLAQDAQRQMEGGRAAIIRPEVRRRLVSSAKGAGLRPFDANLVIAIAQDAARRGEQVGPSLALVGGARRERLRPLALLALSVGLGAGLLLALLAWFLQG